MLIVSGGLPRAGKTAIFRAVAIRWSTIYFPINTIEQAIRNAGVLSGDIGSAGYDVGNALAEDNLITGGMVVIDCVNLMAESRRAWKAVAARTTTRLIELEIICSDPLEHRRRVEGPISDILDPAPPT